MSYVMSNVGSRPRPSQTSGAHICMLHSGCGGAAVHASYRRRSVSPLLLAARLPFKRSLSSCKSRRSYPCNACSETMHASRACFSSCCGNTCWEWNLVASTALVWVIAVRCMKAMLTLRMASVTAVCKSAEEVSLPPHPLPDARH
eukprot:821103-Rhodomonas_salina.1